MATKTQNKKRASAIAERAKQGEQAWAKLGVRQRRELLERMVALIDVNAAQWVEAAIQIKGIDPDSPLVGEEWLSGPWATVTYCQALIGTLKRMEEGTNVVEGFKTRRVPGDRVALSVLPATAWDHLLLSGFSAEVWHQPGHTEADIKRTAGLGMLEPEKTAGTCLVLGAGNITSIPPLDMLYVLYADNRALATKLNPITDPLLPVFEAIFQPFLEVGAVQIFTSDVELGQMLAHHDDIDAVHMTGSELTHDAIVWGTGEEQQQNKEANTPLLTKHITSELGGVSPTIVVPGKWSRSDIEFQANHVATQRLHNSGSNCVASQMVIVSSDWAQKDEFLAALRKAMAEAPERPAWYPNTDKRVAQARETHQGSEAVGGTEERTLLCGLDFAADDPAFENEYFGPVLGVAELPGSGAAFLRNAINTSNEKLRGTLGANIVIDPKTEKSIGSEKIDQMLADLIYGTIGVNAWTAVGYLSPLAVWGAFPGHPLNDVQSGRGVVHNALLLAMPERTVVRGPFRPSPRSLMGGEMSIAPKPPWFVNNTTAAHTGKLLTHFAAEPGAAKLPAIFASALRG